MVEEKVVEMLNVMAVKLGVATEHLWEIMVRQAFVSSAVDVFIYLFWCAVGYVSFILLKRVEDKEARFYLYCVGALGFGLVMIIIGICFSTTITGFINPEYWALNAILEKVK